MGTVSAFFWTTTECFHRVVAHAGYLLRRLAIDPFIANHACGSRWCSSHYCRMPGSCLGLHVIEVCIHPKRSLAHQALDTTWAKEVAKTFEIVVTKLIHDDQQDQARPLGGF